MDIQNISAETPEELYKKIGPELVSSINDTVEARGKCILGIVGGRSIPGLLSAINAKELSGPIEVFWLDERVGKDKNYKPVRWLLWKFRLRGIKIAWHPIKGLSKNKATQSAEICFQKLKDLRKEPEFDIVVVSSGEDGHVASLFPGNAILTDNTTGYAVVEDSPKPPPIRITVTPPFLLTASEGFLLFTGDKKAAYEKFKSGASVEDCPAKLLEKLPKLTVCTALT